ncbi:MAG: cyclic pyranopterin monophosphate synthase MoaC [Planctomycetes bacterium]|nr:cyclic pyranopterin monophosphate synthase MoaC [Planctomycetota bacterium]MCH9727567.1 cyclic pyranopterin monophosphate synthase MoaC [Planctomycetota bacterium]MCH9777453.1 cyclic pyranopterin monophosphate synthase MoaC [Planctomycetota bacterium]MCH9789384.1 cyclic pyranopterin monophosphate synthase MoaC [Planctomycetota bacterium]MDF1744205.1 cyclic pyranopterin monophosphate synthase MoaC [Gimesia sp.]
MSELTHFDEEGASRMVDVGGKEVTSRTAIAESFVTMQPETQKLILDRQISKGDVLEIARIAGIMAAKKTADLIPLCHPLGINSVSLDFEPRNGTVIRVESTVKVDGKTGVEMEALTAVSIAALTIYDMCKAVDRAMSLGPTRLVEKSGGKSGHYKRVVD